MALTEAQTRMLATVERVASILSILGVITIIGTFACSRHFRNPMHRLIFINAFYNLFDFIATMIATSGPAAGNSSALCQFQGFCLQMFPMADVLWTLAMACDVFLVVYYQFNVQALRKLEIWYIAIITSIVSIPAIVFLFIHTPEKGPMYGSVTLWCSISPNWVVFRVVFYYGPIWFLIVSVLLFYILVGIKVIKLRHQFNLSRTDHIALSSNISTSNHTLDQHKNAVAVTVQIDIQSQPASHVYPSSTEQSPHSSRGDPSSHNAPLGHQRSRHSNVSFRQYILMPMVFFLVLLATWVAPTINRLSALVNPNHVSYPLLLAVGAMGSLRGFWNGVVFITLGMKGWKRELKLRLVEA
ncbi:cyclic AMP receptor-like protein A [Aspergillus udagawae]|uniref:Cyclic AMP receptor-like protein A n=1 Tax=Aspergillus udagawae TaxID=91492 RepID=A0ABQ1AKE9_9EURO|nr:cyclic AMP receptor-like protein A [Aspergillus udagawae]GFG05588.1 cyclic AMP receptor-like protein A [Aspergillus udagawae]